MTKFLEQLPLPICGLMLALASMGNLLGPIGEEFKYACGILAVALFVLVILKLIFDFRSILNGLKNPVVAGVIPTFSMGIMILSTYIIPLARDAAYVVWFAGLAIHIALMLSYFFRFIVKANIDNIYPSSFIPFVGLVAASATAPAFGMVGMGIAIFWFGLVSYFVALPVVLYRIVKVGKLNPGTMPLLGIFAAPASLCLLAYLSLFKEINEGFTLALIALAFASTIAVIILLPSILKREFYPSYAALGFPFVVSALAIAKAAALQDVGPAFLRAALPGTAFAQRIAAMVILAYVLARYAIFLFAKPKRS